MRRVLIAVASGLALTALAPAQQLLVSELDSKLASLPLGSAAYYQASLDRVAALWRYDLREAARAGEQLWDQTKDNGPLGVAEAAAARVAIALTEADGANAAAVWVDRATEPPLEADLHIRADYFLTRARNLCMLEKHSEELPLAIKSQGCAEQCGDWIRRIEAMMITVGSLPNRGMASVQKLAAEAIAADAQFINYLQPGILLAVAEKHFERGSVKLALRKISDAEEMAASHGNRTVLAEVAMFRARIAAEMGHRNEAAGFYILAGERYREMNNLNGVVLTIDLRAELAIAAGELEHAHELINQELEYLVGRGWSRIEWGSLVTQRNLAIKEQDGALVDELSTRIAELEVEEHKESVRYVDVAAELSSKERERAEMERELSSERLASAEQSQFVWMFGAILGGLAVGAVLAVSWIGRRRLLSANQKLAEKVDQVHEAREAQSRLEERMRQMQRTEGLGTLAAGIAHDFNNLLTSMISGAELLRVPGDQAERRELADMILAAGQQGSRLCRQLQAYSGGAPLTREPFDLRQIIIEMVPTLIAAVKGGLQVHLQKDSHQTVALVDRGQFEQILLNLVLNSHEADARNVWIGIGEATATDGSGERTALLQIIDDGGGMSAEVAERIFDPFFTTKFPGRGLGLAVVFGGVRRHGGQVMVDSPDAGGARFTIHLPLAEKGVVLPRPPAKVLDNHHAVVGLAESVSVIIVDDEAIVRLALVRMLRKIGVKAHAFEHGAKAVDFVRESSAKKFCIALVDLTMPKMDGTEVIRQLRATGRQVSCVLMSGHADDYVEECARQLNPDRLLSKPFMMGEVRQIVMELTAEMHPVT